MTDSERFDILKNKKIENIPISKELTKEQLDNIQSITSFEDLNKYFGAEKRSIIKTYTNNCNKRYKKSNI